MAVTPKQLTFTNENLKTFVFTKPVGTYGKTQPGLVISDGSGGVSVWFLADIDNGDGTMTGTVMLGDAKTCTAAFQIYDIP